MYGNYLAWNQDDKLIPPSPPQGFGEKRWRRNMSLISIILASTQNNVWKLGIAAW